MSSATLDRERLRQLFDLRSSYNEITGGSYQEDPYPRWHELRETGPIHEGTVHELLGCDQPLMFQGLPYPDRRHFSVFSYDACYEAFRSPDVFASAPAPVNLADGAPTVTTSLLSMSGAQHRRYRGLVQPSFLPSNARWWTDNWVDDIVRLLVDGFAGDGRAELNVDLCAPIPILTITGSFGVPVEQALDIRAALAQPDRVIGIVAPIVSARRLAPADDLISVLVRAELIDDDGNPQQLSDTEIYSFALLLLAAGSGTTWKQLGITLTTLLQRPALLDAIRADRTLMRPVIEESLRWLPTDPMFSRWVTDDIDFHGTRIPAGSVVHLCVGAANRDPARWDNPDEYDITRPLKSSLAFGQGNHICLGMHVARAEMHRAIGTLIDRLPNLRLDPGAETPRFIGLYERGATAIPVLFDAE